jgi:hypothetical protein
MLYVKFLTGISSQDSASATFGKLPKEFNMAYGHSAKISLGPLAHGYKPAAHRYVKYLFKRVLTRAYHKSSV